MTIQLRNQKPAILNDTPFNLLPDINPTLSNDEYLGKLNAHLKTHYVEPMYEPINPNHPVVIEDTSNNKQIDMDNLLQAINYLWQNPTLDVNLQNQVTDIYRQGIRYHAPNDWYFEEQLGVEALTRFKMPIPVNSGSRLIKYTASVDVIPSAKTFLAQGDETSALEWFATITGYSRNFATKNYLLLTVQTADVFNDIKQLMQNFTQAWQSQNTVSREVNQLLSDFDKINLDTDLSAGLFLPNKGGSSPQEQDPMSFTRILMYVLSQYEKNTQNPGGLTVQPTQLHQLYYPENLFIMNLENYAHAKPSEIKKDWETFDKAVRTKDKLNFVSNKRLMTATALDRATSAHKSSTATSRGYSIARAKIKAFSGKPIPAKDMLYMMRKIINSQITKQVTQNTYKTTKRSFMRANRRRPDDINMPGKVQTTHYRPDIHIYLDTSGSISESQYRDAITNLILLTQKINCNLYFTSFSHYVSQTTLIKTKGKSLQNIYREFTTIPKVSGGTDFEQVWRKIDMIDEYNQRSNKSYQINFIITDFGYNLSRNHYWDVSQASLKYTYYVPISTDTRSWQHVLRWANEFRLQMVKAGDYRIRRRMLM